MTEAEKSENSLKYENYREQFTRLRRTMNAGFNLEAIFIEYALLEDRTESVLRHAGLWEAYLKKRGRYGATLESKVKYVQNFAREKKALLHRYFGDGILDEILAWKEERNRLIHALLKQDLAAGEIAGFAGTGKELAEKLRNRVSNYKYAARKKQ
ncbi:MAG: hypothetical protein II776_00280 [Clostridia bacterium]|nr:hypothetical protein [Clostridia bacterium]